MSRKKKRKSTDGEESEAQNPFGALSELSGLPEGSVSPPQPTSRRNRKNTSRGRIDIIRESAHRGGKIVTVVTNFKGIGLPEKQELAKKIQKSYGVGGTVKDGRIEIRGDLREEVKLILEEAGFQPVFAGG
tara:strand:- start:726 stop:1118 length:393 start_codon:yes stop_codon:yes gene_type:complete